MKYFIWLLSSINLYFGFYFLLNVLNILQSSKYGKGATLVMALLLLTMGFGAFYISIAKNNQKLALLLGFGPWILVILFMLFTMLTSDYK